MDRDYFDPRFGVGCRRKESDCKEDYCHDFAFKEAYNEVFAEQSWQCRPPTFAGGGRVGIVDYLYFTQNNLQCLGVTQPLPEYMMNVEALLLPNQNWVSDHLPIAGVFKVLSRQRIIAKQQRRRKRKGKKQKMRKRDTSSGWLWHEINSF